MRRTLSLAVALVVLLALGGSAAGSARRLILWTETVPLAWGDSRLEDLLVTELSRDPDLRVLAIGPAASDRPRFPSDRYNTDSLLDWGTEVGGRYLLVVTVKHEALERRKTFSVPLIFHRWETIGVIRGELRLLDLQKRRLLTAESFSVEFSGPQQFQGLGDDNRNDPLLHIAASEKSRFFEALEAKLARQVIAALGRLTRGR